MIKLDLCMPWVFVNQIFEQAALILSVFFSKLLLPGTYKEAVI